MPFLEVLTRTNGRPTLLERNRAGLVAQTDGDWTQTFLVDEIGRGLHWANKNLGDYAPRLIGEYVWVLDDDDVCICPEFVAGLKGIVSKSGPDVVFVRMHHGPEGVLPDARRWRRAPQMGRIGMSAFVVRRGLWQAHAHAFDAPTCADYRFIRSVWDSTPRVYWWDIVASRIQRRSWGARGEVTPGTGSPNGEMPPENNHSFTEALDNA